MKNLVSISFFLFYLTWTSFVFGQCDDMFITNKKTGSIHDLVTTELRISPILQLKNTEDNGIILVVTTTSFIDSGDKLEFISGGKKHSFDFISSEVKGVLESRVSYQAIAQLDLNTVKLFSKNEISVIRLFSKAKMEVYPYRLGITREDGEITNTIKQVREFFECFYNELNKKLVKDKKIGSSINALSNKVAGNNLPDNYPVPEYCANIISPTAEGQASSFFEVIPITPRRTSYDKDVFDCRMQFRTNSDGTIRIVITSSRNHITPTKNMKENDAMVFFSNLGERKLFRFVENTTQGENLTYKFNQNSISLSLDDLKWFSDNDVSEVRIADMTMNKMYPHLLTAKNTDRLRKTAQCFIVATNPNLLVDKKEKPTLANTKNLPPELDIDHHFHHSHRIWDINDLHLSTEEAAKKYTKLLEAELVLIADPIFQNIVLSTEIGIAFYEQKQYNKAIPYFERVLEIIEREQVGLEVKPQIEAILAAIYLNKEEHEMAANYNVKALYTWIDGIINPDDWEHVYQANLNQGRILMTLEPSDKNIEFYEKSVKNAHKNWERELKRYKLTAIKHYDHPEKSMDFNLALLSFKHAQELIAYFDKHEQLSKEIEVLMDFGKLYFEAGELEEAKSYYKEALDLMTTHYDETHPKLAEARRVISEISLAQKSYDDAMVYANKVLEGIVVDESLSQKLDEISSPIEVLNAITTKGIIIYEENKKNSSEEELKKVLGDYKVASEILLELRKTHRNEGGDYHLDKATDKLSQHAVVVCDKLHKMTNEVDYLDKAFDYAELAKGGVLYEVAQDITSASGVPKEEIQRENALKTQLEYLKSQVFYELQQGENKDEQAIKKLEDAITLISKEHEKILEHFKKEYPKYYELKYNNKSIKVSDLQAVLSPDEVFLEYVATDSFIYVLAISNDEVKSQFVNLKEPLSKTVKILQYALKNRKGDWYKRSGDMLYESTLAGLSSFIKNKKLIIAPDAELHYIPFGVLPTNKIETQGTVEKVYSETHYLIEDHPICYNHSASAFVASKYLQHSRSNHQISTWAPHFETMGEIVKTIGLGEHIAPLPEAEKEANLVAKLFGNKAHVGQDATELKFKDIAGLYSLLHIATHGILNDAKPLSSSLILSNEGDEDGLLYASELYDMELSANMAVLSACNSGMGKLSKAEGVIGVASGFTYAGVPNIVMSKWSVSDWSTALLMKSFYEHLKTGMPKDEALQLAKIEYLRANRDREQLLAPFFWGAFVLRGNTEPIDSLTPLGYNYLFYGVGILLLVILFFVIKRRKKRQTT